MSESREARRHPAPAEPFDFERFTAITSQDITAEWGRAQTLADHESERRGGGQRERDNAVTLARLLGL